MSQPTPSESVLDVMVAQSRRVLETYRVDHRLIEEHANGERRIHQGGYGDRQIYELVQNGADELRADPGGEIGIVLTTTHLYCANQGDPITPEGMETILRMGVSRKRGGQIGRFGVGVKSVLSVSDSPQFFSSTGAVGFDREWSAEQIRSVYPEAEEIPVLRMAQPLERDKAVAADPVLAELLEWATTVVRLPLKPESVNRLGKDLKDFPREFPLFSSHVGTVTMEDRREAPTVKRTISQAVDGDRHTIQEEKSDGSDITTAWRVFTRTVRPGKAMLATAGELHDRPEIDISWAVPDRAGRIRDLGTFWAFFPTNYATLLRGILNAPWKTSEDRQNLYRNNVFNDELIREAAELVVDSLPELTTEEDPAFYIDLLPGRGREAPQWADRQLTDAIWQIAALKPSLPDQAGGLRRPSQVRLHPDELKPEWLTRWASHPGRPVDWCHHSVETRDRRPRVKQILDGVGRFEASVREWLEALVEDESPEGSILAIRIVADMRREKHKHTEEAAKARIVLIESDGLVAPVRGKLFRRSSDDTLSDNLLYVHPSVAEDFHAMRALDDLGIHEADTVGRFSAVVEQGFHGYTDDKWTAFWDLSRQIAPASAVAILREHVKDIAGTLKVKSVAGEFSRMGDCLLPGVVVPDDGSRDARIAVDTGFHEHDRSVLRDLGMRDRPVMAVDPTTETWFGYYVEFYWDRYCKQLPANASRPQLKTMRAEGATPAGPLHFLTELSEEGRAAFLHSLPPSGHVTSWTMKVGALQHTRHQVTSPFVWMARSHGSLRTSRGLRRVPRCVGPALRKYGEILPVADVPTGLAEALKLPQSLGDVRPATWTRLLREAETSEDETFPGKVYALVLEAEVDWPEDIATRCRVGDTWSNEHPDEEIAVTAVRAEYEALVREQVPALLAPTMESAERMIEEWMMLSPSDVIQKEVRYVTMSEPALLVDEFPQLRLHRAKVDGWSLARCSELDEITRSPKGERLAPIPEASQDHIVLVKNPEDDLEALMAVDRVLKLGLGRHGCRSILDHRETMRRSELKRKVRTAKDETDKILLAVGADALKSRLPRGLVESEEARTGRPVDDKTAAKLAIDAFGQGSGLMRTYGKDIAARIPDAPTRFSGDNTARQFVNELGLPESYAGTKIESLPPTEHVDGPTQYPRLHDYQERLAATMYGLLTERLPGKAMLSLPTGAGKTRIATEAVIRVFKEQGLQGPVLWIAQTWELCEQAVQSWKFVWQKVGPAEPLTISRLWNAYEAAANDSGPHLVVATDVKLQSVLDKEEYSWLREAAVVIADEAHSSYDRMTPILRSLGITHNRTTRPLVGLSATPYRGFNVDETRLLTQRYGHRRLDEGIFPGGEPFAYLQDLGVLARVEHRELPGATIRLSDDELKAADFRGLPTSAEQRLAADDQRNATLLDEIERMPPDWPVLFFATSVDHARLMTARLNGIGIRSATIDSETPTADRRTRINDFRTGKIRVLTNYNVLAQGFDAPATRAVVVARPTYSPNIYTQMIGRGLRGPLNGGKDVCTILDVHDNIANYDRRLAFTGFEHLWRAE